MSVGGAYAGTTGFFVFVLDLGKRSITVTHTHTHARTRMHSCTGNNGWTQSGCEVSHNEDPLENEHHELVKAQKVTALWKIAIHPPPPCLSYSVSFLRILLPPSFAWFKLSLLLSPPLSDTLLTKSRLLCSELFCDLFLIFHINTACVVGGRRERGRTHSPIQSLPGADDKSWLLLVDQGCVTISVASPHCDLNNFCSARGGSNLLLLLPFLLMGAVTTELSLRFWPGLAINTSLTPRGIEKGGRGRMQREKKDPINISEWRSRNPGVLAKLLTSQG